MGLLPKKKKNIFFNTGRLVKECCDKIPFCNIGRLHKGFVFSPSRNMCMCFFKSDDCMVKEEGNKKRKEKDKEADLREKKKKEKKKRKEKKKVERVWFCRGPYDF